MFPNVESLSLSHLNLTYHQHYPGPKRTLNKLTNLRLWQVESYTDLTRHWTPRLTSAFMWNLVMTDNDLSEAILASPCSQTLQDIRIGGDEIGFVRLSESSTKESGNTIIFVLEMSFCSNSYIKNFSSILLKIFVHTVVSYSSENFSLKWELPICSHPHSITPLFWRKEGAKQAALILMKNSHFNWTQL